MSYYNNDFLEEYKRLDKLCRELYQSEKGVTRYIEDMENIPPYQNRAIPNWNADLKQLKELRHLRNQLTHEIGTLDISLCTPDDINCVREFHHRILTQSDPVALLRKAAPQPRMYPIEPESYPCSPPPHENAPRQIPQNSPKSPRRFFGLPAAFAVFSGIVVTGVVLLILLKLFLP